ncbi:glycoside hydrolase family 130 protein [candidate division KSB1 bacterium]|nr:glycoside hydrolase family 130 protein [candidate division KSB1 bacterium]
MDGIEVVGVFNPAACKFQDEYILVVRVAEMCIQTEGWFKIPIMNFTGERPQLEIKSWKQGEINLSDPRKFWAGPYRYLSSISHLRLARSTDGVHFTFSDNPFMFADLTNEAFGVEDARITQIGDTCYLTYTAVSINSFGVSLAGTVDFQTVQRYGMILAPENKDSCLFPEKINGKYVALHRPSSDNFGRPSVWYCESPDLLHWGNHSCLLAPYENQWERQKIGVGPQPLKTSDGWLVMYHGCGDDSVYSLHLCLLDLNDPRKVLKRTSEPVFVPETDWEKNGFFPNVVFCNGWIREPDDRVLIYYGAADSCICVAETTVNDLMGFLDRGKSKR